MVVIKQRKNAVYLSMLILMITTTS